jgi:hypothetical protein
LQILQHSFALGPLKAQAKPGRPSGAAKEKKLGQKQACVRDHRRTGRQKHCWFQSIVGPLRQNGVERHEKPQIITLRELRFLGLKRKRGGFFHRGYASKSRLAPRAEQSDQAERPKQG